MLPCIPCRNHANAHIEKYSDNLNEIVSNRDSLFEFFWNFHNYVSERLGKPTIPLEDAYKLYSGKADVTKLQYCKKE